MAFRCAGFDVYDFREPLSAFSWKQLGERWQEWNPREFMAALEHPLAIAGYQRDLGMLHGADIVILVQPSGRSAALEMGYAAGMGKKTAVLLALGEEPELMLKLADYLTDSLHELLEWARKQ